MTTNAIPTGNNIKKFSTAAALLVFVASFVGVTATTTVYAEAAGKQLSARCGFLPSAPDQHKVVRGDTLWGISSRFLQNAWCWPQVWDMNKEEIRNPHWIYPGQIVYFDRAAGRLRLGTPKDGSGNGTDKLSPEMRVNGLGRDAITAIPAELIAPFLSQPLIIEEGELQHAPHIVGVQEGHVSLGRGDKAYVRGDLGDATSFQVFRPGQTLKDPATKKVIGHEAIYLGTLKLVRAGKTADEAHTFMVADSKEEMAIGDLLAVLPLTPVQNYVPHPPTQDTQARVVSIYGGVANAGQNQIVSINVGTENNIEIGHVLQLYRFGKTIVDPSDKKHAIKLPDEEYGSLFVFRTFKHISYGLIMQVRDTVEVGDIARSPE
ncbi:MAG: LysM peptidoglycan-binding domain-containing protein [Glaciimonas sp.]|nr:LysM peptidoglycan-binding domain-containing protein [Glaciimonas sp.]